MFLCGLQEQVSATETFICRNDFYRNQNVRCLPILASEGDGIRNCLMTPVVRSNGPPIPSTAAQVCRVGRNMTQWMSPCCENNQESKVPNPSTYPRKASSHHLDATPMRSGKLNLTVTFCLYTKKISTESEVGQCVKTFECIIS